MLMRGCWGLGVKCYSCLTNVAAYSTNDKEKRIRRIYLQTEPSVPQPIICSDVANNLVPPEVEAGDADVYHHESEEEEEEEEDAYYAQYRQSYLQHKKMTKK